MKEIFYFFLLCVFGSLFFMIQRGIIQKLDFITEKLKEPCAVYDVATDYVIISEKDIIGINKKEK